MKQILILGGGFGGIRAALDLHKKLSAKEVTITLIDKNNYHLFLPALYEVATAYGLKLDPYAIKLRKTASISYEDIFAGTKVKVMQASIVKVDLQTKKVTTGGGEQLPYDYLVFALGTETETFGIPGVAEYTYKFKTINEAVFLHNEISLRYERAARGRHTLPIKFIIAGAGFNGVELAGELACCVENIKKACRLGQRCTDMKIIEAAPQILPMISDKERKIIRKRLEYLGVQILTNSPIKEVGPDFVIIGEREGTKKLTADFIIWTAGIRATSFLSTVKGLKLDLQGKIPVTFFLQTENYPEVFAIGDNNVFIDSRSQKPVSALAYVAVDQGKTVSENIKRLVFGNKKLLAYKPFDSVWVAPVGGKYAIAHLGRKITLSGFLAWLCRVLIDFRYFASILPLSKALTLLYEEEKVFLKND